VAGSMHQMEKSCQLGLKPACIIVALSRQNKLSQQQHKNVSP